MSPPTIDAPLPPPEDHTLVDRLMRPARVTLRKLGLLLLAVMVALPVLQVVLREFTPFTFVGAGELTRFMLICIVFITLPYVAASGVSIRMEELTADMRAQWGKALRMLIAASGMVGFGVAAWSVGLATLRNLNNATPTLGIPYWVFFSAAFVGLLFAALECAIQMVKAWRGTPLYVSFEEEMPPEDLPEI
ncbi:TRAP transporter small permease [Aquibaculum arenosum]|uniref:TRAP transporter small permease protein n=1 Tax=Aquibaculum arenosum TaxID=3032591 RepID=A0ABT5YNB0_9PROT|nr:TRAP transporter small permease [Fodinicurvata sp. CAU 1616]MDF2096465.1 TRAP transporter small permease [Fodinicurvata sp. CAU 1616]